MEGERPRVHRREVKREVKCYFSRLPSRHSHSIALTQTIQQHCHNNVPAMVLYQQYYNMSLLYN